MFRRLVAILMFGRRTESVTGAVKVIDDDTIVVADQLGQAAWYRSPELDQPFWWQGQKLMGGTMALAALEALTAGVKVRCKAVEPLQPTGGAITRPPDALQALLGDAARRIGTTWPRVTTLPDDWLPRPRIVLLWASQRFAVKYPR